MGEQIVDIFESFVRESIALIVNSCLNVCKEIFKFYLILLMLYYLTLWSFRVLAEFSLSTPVPGKNYFRMEYASETPSAESETLLRVGAPDEKLIKQRASLLEQLEIEAEFEENIKQRIRAENSFKDPEVHSTATPARNSSEVASFKDLFISQEKYERNETSRPSQTNKTSLGKKTKPRQENLEESTQAISTLIDQPENRSVWQDVQANNESDANALPASSVEYETQLSDSEQKKAP